MDVLLGTKEGEYISMVVIFLGQHHQKMHLLFEGGIEHLGISVDRYG
jgi:hypothetical protein